MTARSNSGWPIEEDGVVCLGLRMPECDSGCFLISLWEEYSLQLEFLNPEVILVFMFEAHIFFFIYFF